MSGLSLRLTSAFPGWGAVALLAVTLAVVVWAYRRNGDRLKRTPLVLLALLRIVLVMLLICCLVEPVLSYRATPKADMPVLLLVDVSQSMSLRDTPDKQTRLDAALAPWTGHRGLVKQVEREFAVRCFTFDAGVRELEDAGALEGLEPAGEMTLIGEALAGAAGQCADQAPAGAVLLTDGADQSTLDTVVQARAIGCPVYVVAVGEVATAASQNPDVAVADVSGDRFMTVKTENELAVRLEQHGYGGKTVTVDVVHEGEVLASEAVELDEAAIDVALRFTPMERGKHVFEVVAHPFDGEEITENNRRTFVSILGSKQVAALYIEGTPRWEYKFLKRALERDPAVAFTGFVRSKSDVFTRQGEKVGEGTLPMSTEDFSAFDLVILGDVAPRFLTAGQQEAIRHVVLEQGKGFLLVPGPQSTADGGFGDTPLADLLPALPVAGSPPVSGDFSMKLTPDGMDHPVFAELDIALAPALPACYVLASPGPGATVLAEHPYESRGGRPLPVCVTQPCGKGRAMVVAVDSTWRWRMGAGANRHARSTHLQFWGQAVRWLTGQKDESLGGADFVAYTGRDYYDPGQDAVLFARIQREGDEAVEADVTAAVRMPSGKVLNTPLEYVAGSGGLYRANLSLDEPGAYEATVSGRKEDLVLGEDTATFFIGEPHREFDHVAMNEPLLRAIAVESGGGFYTPVEARAIADDLIHAVSEQAHFAERRLAHMPQLYFFMIACVTLEWFLRKRRGLM